MARLIKCENDCSENLVSMCDTCLLGVKSAKDLMSTRVFLQVHCGFPELDNTHIFW